MDLNHSQYLLLFLLVCVQDICRFYRSTFESLFIFPCKLMYNYPVSPNLLAKVRQYPDRPVPAKTLQYSRLELLKEQMNRIRVVIYSHI